MLDIKAIRANPERFEQELKKRNMDGTLEQFMQLDEKRRKALTRVEELKKFRNLTSQEVGRLKKNNRNPDELMAKVREIAQDIKALDEQIKAIEYDINKILLNIPNLPHHSVPVGKGEAENVEVRRWGTPNTFNFEPKAHWDIGPELNILDFERAAKLSGARFTVYKGKGAQLERAVINFFIDIHIYKHGYTEILPPYMVSSACMLGTGQLPKFDEDMFRIEGHDFYLIPTAEVPLTNLFREEVIEAKELPIYLTAYTPCF
ncbi:MAG: serine--tRNA ligase, partial [Syntrophomonadaceae bacterium]|nr:serine--tRNA ligase [Syntrophomonadaceae bacterium]